MLSRTRSPLASAGKASLSKFDAHHEPSYEMESIVEQQSQNINRILEKLALLAELPTRQRAERERSEREKAERIQAERIRAERERIEYENSISKDHIKQSAE